METSEKIDLIDSLEETAELNKEHFTILKSLSTDNDSFVRSRCAGLLVNFENNQSKQLLIQLAVDSDELVRTEAYDSLSVFVGDIEVEAFLRQAISHEMDELARSYAILSWADVSVNLDHIASELMLFLKKTKSSEKSPNCSLSCCYAMYILGQREILEEMLSYLKNDNYQIRCSAISLLEDIIDETNKDVIRASIIKLLVTEDTVAVKSSAERFLEEN